MQAYLRDRYSSDADETGTYQGDTRRGVRTK